MNVETYAHSTLPLTREALCAEWAMDPDMLEKNIRQMGHSDILRVLADMRLEWREKQGDPCPRTGRQEWLTKWGLTRRRYDSYRRRHPVDDSDMTSHVREAMRSVATRFDRPLADIVKIVKRL